MSEDFKVKISKPNALEVVRPNTDDLQPMTANVEIDPNTGINRVVSDSKVETNVNATDINTIDKSYLPESMVTDEESIKEFKGTYGGSTEDIQKIMRLMYEYDHKITTTGLYNKLPPTFKILCSEAGATNLSMLNKVAKEFIESLIHEYKFNKEFNKEFIDLQESINNEMKKMNIGNAFLDYTDEQMKGIDQLIEAYKDNPEKLQKLKDIKEPYLDAISFSRLKENIGKVKGVKGKNYEREMNSFNYKYRNNTKFNFSITDVKTVGVSLKRHLDLEKYTEDDIMKFVVYFCRLCLNYNPDNIREHVFMYYTIRTINLLDILDNTSKEYNNILDNVKEVIDKLKEM